jgi:hypothetical protein
MKHTVATGEQSLTGDVLTPTGLSSWLKTLTCSYQGMLLLVEEASVRQFVGEENFGLMDVWEQNPERLG